MSIQSRVLREFTSHPGEILHAEDIAATTGLTNQQVTQAVWQLVARHGHAIVKVSAGSWKYDPDTTAKGGGRRLFEELATTNDGVIILQDEDGRVLFGYDRPQ